MSRRRLTTAALAVGALLLGVSQAVAATSTGAGPAPSPTTSDSGNKHQPHFDWHPRGQAAPTRTSQTKSVPMWSSSIVDGETTYPYTMVGTNPAQTSKKTSSSTSVSTVVVPLVLTFPDGTVEHP